MSISITTAVYRAPHYIGPKVYNYYTHDLKNTINKEDFMICFADDTNLIMSGTNPNELIKKNLT